MNQEKANEIRIEVLKSSIGGYKPDRGSTSICVIRCKLKKIC